MTLDAMTAMAPSWGMILGSGLGPAVQAFQVHGALPFSAIPELPTPRVTGHAGQLTLVSHGSVPMVIAQGRSHLYEGRCAQEVTAQIRLMHRMGVRQVVLTNAAGAINETFAVGELMLISDHINLTGTSPLLGGPHFQDMTTAYCPVLRAQINSIANSLSMPLHSGVYAGLIGPQYETPAEIRMLRAMGADAVGMSTVLECIQARALGMSVLGLSTLTNWAAGVTGEALDHSEVITTGAAAAGQIANLITRLIAST
jgi:purine-nucleoside phosphorylase